MNDFKTATSADGTSIAYEAYGTGPVAVVVGGAFCDRGAFRDLAQALGEQGLTGVTYDRRGRGDSGDTLPYAVPREIEDLTAVISHAGESSSDTYVFGISSGGALVVEAIAAGAPVTKGSAIEVPYRTAAWPPVPDDYIGTLERFEAAGDREGILRYFNTTVVGMPDQMVDGIKGTPMWDPMLAMTYTVKYDGFCLGGDDQSLPTEALARVTVPFLTVCSSGTAMPWLHDSAGVLADALPDGRAVELPGDFHHVPAEVLAPALAEFYRS
ncbi:alpha/beta hydrolase [Terrabacter aerolatus]|uniref:Alpha/beta hydrolase n=1 Tax=Terrabacter aerolatus TaxID=422442 RepID=A0A512D2M4_9MICO|nr:alpha/beta hydrolase [Terrabacter aerolatus]GEO30725.1 alpha/beta hydrolase [Terrabacter aerolatus]